MAIKAKLKLSGDLPWSLEHKLISSGGFKVFSRRPKEWVILEKLKPSNFQPTVIDGKLDPVVVGDLLRRCNNICNMFHEPELHTRVIRMRLNNICLTLSPLERDFVQQWMNEFVVEDQ